MSFGKKDINKNISTRAHLSNDTCNKFLVKFLDIIKNTSKTKIVKISNFGTFSVKKKNSRLGRNPKTGDEKEITARNVISFYPSKTMKSKIS